LGFCIRAGPGRAGQKAADAGQALPTILTGLPFIVAVKYGIRWLGSPGERFEVDCPGGVLIRRRLCDEH
jgi:hypothetical protein